MSQNVTHPSRALARGIARARVAIQGTKPQMKNVVHTRTLRTPWSVTLW